MTNLNSVREKSSTTSSTRYKLLNMGFPNGFMDDRNHIYKKNKIISVSVKIYCLIRNFRGSVVIKFGQNMFKHNYVFQIAFVINQNPMRKQFSNLNSISEHLLNTIKPNFLKRVFFSPSHFLA